MSRGRCAECGAFISECAKCEKRPSLAPTYGDHDWAAHIQSWAERRRARGQDVTVGELIGDVRAGRV